MFYLYSRHLRPTMPQLLELNRLSKNHDLNRMPTVGRNSFLYLGEWWFGVDICDCDAILKPNAQLFVSHINPLIYLSTGKEKSSSSSSSSSKDSAQEVLFLRSITLSSDSISPQGAERIVLMALDELDRAQLDPRVRGVVVVV